MFKNLDYYKYAKEAMAGYIKVAKYNSNSNMDPKLRELVLTRASQLNGCAYCLNMHTIDAINVGESHQRLHVLAGWRESKLFSNREKLALELTERITKLHETHFEDEFYERFEAEFTEQEFVDLVILIAQINVWNTFGVVFAKDIDENYK